MDEEAALRDIAVRQESRASLTLHLLGQRFGVMAGAPAFDAERIPLGPRSLCRIMREAGQSLQLPLESRLLLYRIVRSPGDGGSIRSCWRCSTSRSPPTASCPA